MALFVVFASRECGVGVCAFAYRCARVMCAYTYIYVHGRRLTIHGQADVFDVTEEIEQRSDLIVTVADKDGHHCLFLPFRHSLTAVFALHNKVFVSHDDIGIMHNNDSRMSLHTYGKAARVQVTTAN
jgi:hypothetical protein